MSQKTRHILLITLCAISALPMCLSAFFLGGRILIRKAMLEKLESAEAVVLRIPANGLNWYEKDHELLIDGRMFDVKSIRPIVGGYEVTGLFDDDETELLDQLVKTECGKKEGGGQFAALFQSCLGLIADIPVAGLPSFDPALSAGKDYPQGPADPAWQMLRAVETPPPDFRS